MNIFAYSENNDKFLSLGDEKWCLVSGGLYDDLISFGSPLIKLPIMKDVYIRMAKIDSSKTLSELTEEWLRKDALITEEMGNGLEITYRHTVFFCDGGTIPDRFFNNDED